jgi:hypothetical protein
VLVRAAWGNNRAQGQWGCFSLSSSYIEGKERRGKESRVKEGRGEVRRRKGEGTYVLVGVRKRELRGDGI